MKLSKIAKKLPDSVIEEIDLMSQAELEKTIAQSEENISRATRERDANLQYRQAKEAVSDLSAGLRDVKAFQNAKIHFALLKIRVLKGEDTGEDLEGLRSDIRSRRPSKKTKEEL